MWLAELSGSFRSVLAKRMANRLGGQYSADHWTLLVKHQIKTADKVGWLADEAVRRLLKSLDVDDEVD
jgi:hypothetical protein